MPALIFLAVLDFERNDLFLDRHYLTVKNKNAGDAHLISAYKPINWRCKLLTKENRFLIPKLKYQHFADGAISFLNQSHNIVFIAK